MKRLLIILLVTVVAFSSCNKEEDDVDTNIKNITSAVYSVKTTRDTKFVFNIKGNVYTLHTTYSTNWTRELDLKDTYEFGEYSVSDIVNCKVTYQFLQPNAPDNEIVYLRLVINGSEHYEWDETQNKFIKQ